MKRFVATSIIMALLFVFLCTPSVAGDTSAYLTGHTPGAGYDPGVGIRVEHTTDKLLDIFALHGMARSAWQEKRGAAQGYTAGAMAQARAYWHGLYLGGGYGVTRYRSEFGDGVVWAKQAWQPHMEVGFDGDMFDFWASYFFRESYTPNHVEAIKLGASAKIWRGLRCMAEMSRMAYLQGGQRETDILTTIGLGWEW